MSNPIPSQANVRTRSLVARADGTPITSGTVNYYLIANTGANAGKWFKTSDNSWSATEDIAGVMTHKADGHWSVSVDAEAWPTAGVEYTEYAKESGDLHVPTSKIIRCEVVVATALGTLETHGDNTWATATGFATAALWTEARAGALTDWINGGRLDLILDAILAMLDDARTEPGQGAPPVNPDLATKIDYLFKAWRNRKTQTATTFSLYADNTTTVDQAATISDDGTTATKGEIGTGA